MWWSEFFVHRLNYAPLRHGWGSYVLQFSIPVQFEYLFTPSNPNPNSSWPYTLKGKSALNWREIKINLLDSHQQKTHETCETRSLKKGVMRHHGSRWGSEGQREVRLQHYRSDHANNLRGSIFTVRVVKSESGYTDRVAYQSLDITPAVPLCDPLLCNSRANGPKILCHWLFSVKCLCGSCKCCPKITITKSENIKWVLWVMLGMIQGHSPWFFSMKMTLESELKFCPVRIICWPPRTEQLSMSCFSTMGSSCAERWAAGTHREVQTERYLHSRSAFTHSAAIST